MTENQKETLTKKIVDLLKNYHSGLVKIDWGIKSDTFVLKVSTTFSTEK